ncbi:MULTISPECIES: sodium/glutamate symporter [Peptoniphilus]|jgi:sodium/glutamate symporter|uniref:sodium/glutamate symporter n=2 Tax=Peptoniphilaceae TaxID=1570339 RepID=UPI002356EE19|nr:MULTISPECIES: sodium/glutamate symporter [Peptoniphilus]MDU1043313.1 sodium/glutamate symporter [Peptoniphilus rhinitidis]MDU1954029.1 sodium/glutamate symporter [Peptoniphilus lacydonensis]MDU2115268.1 sodium/glutamate symporter [Peptoniphilus lacydonensis]MDU3750689.1 sodium/glutamate symporter [Peptoniphilus rhinitidis]MDU5275183.1 sodium/glutamate symporter [Peptoniphilus lacydonensis]
MEFVRENGILTINLDSILTLALAVIVLLVGYGVKNKSEFLRKYCIPAPVVGGFIFMFITFIGYKTNSFNFAYENIFQSTFMLAFFTTVGLGANLKILKSGGKLLIIYWLLCGLLSLIQNTIGVGVAKAVNLEPAYGMLASSISMIGGHGAAMSYGNTFAKMGYEQAPVVGAAAATFGLIFGVLIGGPLGRRLIVKNDLKPDNDDFDSSALDNLFKEEKIELTNLDVIKNVSAIIICMALGTLVSKQIGKAIKMDFPDYVGAMFVAVILRNINEKANFYKFSAHSVDGIGDVMLNLYLALALMTLKLWELQDLMGGVLIVLICQVVFMLFYTYFIVFKVLGKNYDAAVMCSGLCGHGLGATPSAIVNMTAINEEYGMSRKAMMIVPIVGAFLVDIIYQPIVLTFIKTFVK